MTLNRIRSRPITVGNTEYRWCISSKRQTSESIATLVIDPTNRGQKLVVQIPSRDFWLDIKDRTSGNPGHDSALYAPITPALVSRIIEAALTMEWSPSYSAGQVEYHLHELLPES